jgi:hypothetical protein
MMQTRVIASVDARSPRWFAVVPVASKETVAPDGIENGTMCNPGS